MEKDDNSTKEKRGFAERVRLLANQSGGISALARLADISEGSVRKYANGLSEPSRDILVAMAENTGTSLEWLATGSGHQTKRPLTVRVAHSIDEGGHPVWEKAPAPSSASAISLSEEELFNLIKLLEDRLSFFKIHLSSEGKAELVVEAAKLISGQSTYIKGSEPEAGEEALEERDLDISRQFDEIFDRIVKKSQRLRRG